MTKGLIVGVVTAMLVVAGIGIGLISTLSGDVMTEQKPKQAKGAPKEATKGEDGTITTPSGLQYKDIKVGDGAEVKRGTRVRVHYTGTLTNGTKFDSSYDRNEPYALTVGAGEVIQGWDEGLQGMKVGGKRKLTVPSDLGYGERGRGTAIPPGATLLFDLEVVEAK
jgi:FKBP-type peptidyl-prolyl cis-trans isomerase